MSDLPLSRRAFLSGAAHAARGSCIVLTLPAILTACNRANQARLAGESFANLLPEEAEDLAAIAARIIPSDETPGANEAGVIYFLDNVLAEDERRQFVLDGLHDLQSTVTDQFGEPYFHLLDGADQDRLLSNIEDGEFFGTMRFLTVAGMFCLPEYGGNRDNSGYELIGFENRHAWTPPFGAYDATYNGGGQ